MKGTKTLMKKITFVCIVLSLVLLLGACGTAKPAAAPTAVPPTEAAPEAQAESPKEEPAGTAAAEEKAEAPEPKSGGSITIAISQDLDQSLDPHVSTSAGKREIFFNIFEGLVKADPDGNFVPALAESYEISDDATVFTFKLRGGVKFHNGNLLTAEDVIYTMDKCRGAETGVPVLAAYSEIESVTAVDDSTIEIKLKNPNIEFLAYLNIAIIPHDYAEQDTFPIGTGPYKFKSRSVQDNIILEKFADYWGEPGYLDEVTFKIIENNDALMMALRSGSADLAVHRVATEVKELGEDYELLESPTNLVQALYLNNAAEPLNDPRVRKALNYAVNVEDVMIIVNEGLGTPIGSSIYPAFGKYFMPELADAYPYDPEKAKELLSEAGYPDGFSLTITAPSNYVVHVNTAQVLAEQFKAIGIDAKINLVEWATWLSEVYQGRNFESTVVGFDASYLTARALLERWISDNSKNMINFNDPEYDRVLKEAFAATSDEEQTALYKQAEKILSDDAANVYLMDPNDLTVISKKLGGYIFYPLFVIDLAKIYYK
jgi:peptide/nickel transport system substrate-binding protein